MTGQLPLKPSELDLVRSVLRQHPEVHGATLFGSRAKGSHHGRSDVDLALSGELGLLGAQAIAAELEELPSVDLSLLPEDCRDIDSQAFVDAVFALHPQP